MRQVQPIWTRICDEAHVLIQKEPLLEHFLTHALLNHPSLMSALGARLATKLYSDEMAYTALRDLIQMVLAADPACIPKVEADLEPFGP